MTVEGDYLDVSPRLLENHVKQDGPIEGSPCWVWTGAASGRSVYGRIRRWGKQEIVHRVSYEEFVGPIPAGLIVRHKCDNPLCINPEHLETGTHADNTKDMFERGRAFDNRGENAGGVKLTEEEVRWIKFWLSQGYSTSNLARRYGVGTDVIYQIKVGNNWSWVECEDPEDCPEEFYPPAARVPQRLIERRA